MFRFNNFLLGLLVVGASIAGLSMASPACAQEKANEAVQSGVTVPLPVFAETTVSTTVSVPGGGVVFARGMSSRPNQKKSKQQQLAPVITKVNAQKECASTLPPPETVQLPLLMNTGPADSIVSVPDAGFVMHSGYIHRSQRATVKQLLARYQNKTPPEIYRFFYNGRSDLSGITTYDIIHDFQPLKIVTHESGKIQVQLVRRYTDANLEKLAKDHPNVALNFNALPNSVNDYAKVELSVDIESNVTVEDLAELAAKHPSIHKIYQHWMQKDQQ